jgi:four helix bundle protein
VKDQRSKIKIQGKSKLQNSSLARYPAVKAETWILEDSAEVGALPGPVFDLEERTAKFGEAIIRFCKQVPKTAVNNRLIDQLVGCGTSIGANYCEASEKVSQKDFKNCISRCVKEAKFFLRMMATAEPSLAEEARGRYREARELHLIFAAIYRK